MVQFFKSSPDPRNEGYGMLAQSLGEGLGNAINTYYANESLNTVLQDKSLNAASPSERMGALQKALVPYGQKGHQILQQRLQIEEQRMQEIEQEKLEKQQELESKKQESIQKQKGQALGRYLNGEALTPEEQSLFTPQEFVAMYKAKNPPSKGGVTAQPIPPEINQRITEVLRNSQGMSSDDLKNVMDSMGIPPVYSNGYIENRRRTEETGSEHDIKFHQESENFEKSVRNHANTARRQIPLIEKGIKSVSEGKVKPGSLANAFSFFGETGRKIGNALLSGDEAALSASIPEFLEGRKELFGVRLSDADLKLLQDKLPDIGKSKEANLAILNLMKKAAEKSIKLEKVAQDVLEKKGIPYRSGKLRPLGYERDVMNAFEDSERNEGTFEQVPPAAQYKGKVIEDDEGRRFKSNGINWEPI